MFHSRIFPSSRFWLSLVVLTATSFSSAAEPAGIANPELKTYLARLPTTPESRFVAAADRFISRGKASGWWNEMLGVYVLAAPSLGAAQLNLKGGGLDLSAVGQILLAPYTGVTSDGKTGYLDTLRPPAQIPGFALEAHSLFVFVQTDVPSLAGEIGASGGGVNLGVRARNAVQGTIWTATRIPVPLPVKSGQGLTGFVRSRATGGFWVKDDQHGDFLQDAKTLPTGALRLLCSGGSNLLSGNQLAFAFIGTGAITPAQAADLSGSCNEMLETLGTRAPAVQILAADAPHAFDRDSINRVTPRGLEVFRLGAPPSGDDVDYVKDYRYGPVNNLVSRPWGETATSTDTQIGRWELIWSDRGLGPKEGVQTAWGKKPNDTMKRIVNTHGQQCRTEFNTYEKAIGSTLVKTAYSAGLKFRHDPAHPDGKGWGDIAEEWGYDVSEWDRRWRANPDDKIFTEDLPADTGAIVHRGFCAAEANVDAFFDHNAVDGVFKVARDRVILGPGRLCDIRMARGFVIDHEHADDRPPELELRFISEMAKIAHCKGLLLGASAHPPGIGAGQHGGWTKENGRPILDLFDWFTLIAPSATPAGGQKAMLQEQYDYFRKPGETLIPGGKFCVQIQIGGPGQEMSVADARLVREFMIEKQIPRCFLSNAYATPGGPLSRAPNQAVAAFLGLPLQ